MSPLNGSEYVAKWYYAIPEDNWKHEYRGKDRLTLDNCKGEIAPRRTKKGRTFYGCTKYPDCKFTSWDKPKAEACPECKHPFMVEKWKKNEDPSILCPECGFKKTNVAA